MGKEVISNETGWICEYEEGLLVFHRVHVVGNAARGSEVNRGEPRSKKAEPLAEPRKFREAFGEIGYGSSCDGSESTNAEDLPDVDYFEEYYFAMGGNLFGYSENEEFID